MSAYHFFGVKFYMDLIIFFNTLFGFFTFVAWAISALILYFIFTKKRFTKLINDQFYNFATSVALFCSIGSLVYSEVVGFIPCKFCWYQRYLMYPIALFLIIGLFNKSVIKAGYLSAVGAGIGIYHIYLQNGGGAVSYTHLTLPTTREV